MDTLAQIMAAKRREIAERIRPVKDAELDKLAKMRQSSIGFRQALSQAKGLAIIAEMKRRSPSAGSIVSPQLDAVTQARHYSNGGADALSVLTDTTYFGGHMEDLWKTTEFLEIHRRPTPCLRKDFMLHPIQVVEAAEAGARAILIIVRALNHDEIRRLHDAARQARLDSLFEIHSERELEQALNHNPDLIGVNNRDLKRFVTDLSFSEKLIPQIPKDILAVSESGIQTAQDAKRVHNAGARAILVGETLMRSQHPGRLIAELKGTVTRLFRNPS